MNRKEPSPAANSQWMLSFADLLSLILTFFVLIYSMAQPMQMTNFYKRDFDSLISTDSDINFSEITVERNDTNITSEYLENVFSEKKSQDPALQNIGLSTELNRLIISIPQSEISDEILEKMAEIVGLYENKKYVFSDSLDKSKSVAEKLRNFDINQGLGFYQQDNIKDRIDIIIYL